MIVINETYFIKPDVYDYTLCRKRKVKSGKNAGTENYDALGHYTSIRNCLKALAELWARSEYKDKDIDLPCYVDAIREEFRKLEEIADKCAY